MAVPTPATSIEQPPVFAGNDLPGVMLASGARRLVSLYAVQPGSTAVVTAGGGGEEPIAEYMSRFLMMTGAGSLEEAGYVGVD